VNLLDGKRAIVTGGASGIGESVVLRFIAEGARVVVFDLNAERAEAVASATGAAVQVVDVADAVAARRAVDSAAKALGGLDVLVNNAGVPHVRPLHATKDEDWRRMIGVNLSGVFHLTRAAVPLMRDIGGVIVNNASASGVRPTRGEGAYSAAKAGVIALTQSAALEYGPAVRVNCVSPGLIRTPMSEPLFTDSDVLAPVRQATPLGRVGTSEEIADVILFLASDLSRFMTGQNLVVDGGMTLPQAGIDDVLRSILERMAKKKRSQEKRSDADR
jgi:NAD(P)-dependent dehydrogenase (short-subunit alcohol dehydrogenase family)